MTVFSTLITGSILIAMTLACLFIAESGTKENSFVTFHNNFSSCLTYLGGETVLSHQWILQVSKTYGIEMEVKDNGNPLFFDKLNPSPRLQEMFQKAAEISRDTYALDLDNAMSYVPDQGKISLSLGQDDHSFILTVKDNGPGIPDDSKEAVFRRFYRGDSSRNDKQHFGLGLCIAREIVLLHRGTVCIEDAPGGGTVFTVRLPRT